MAVQLSREIDEREKKNKGYTDLKAWELTPTANGQLNGSVLPLIIEKGEEATNDSSHSIAYGPFSGIIPQRTKPSFRRRRSSRYRMSMCIA
jgi:hypothetical protein